MEISSKSGDWKSQQRLQNLPSQVEFQSPRSEPFFGGFSVWLSSDLCAKITSAGVLFFASGYSLEEILYE